MTASKNVRTLFVSVGLGSLALLVVVTAAAAGGVGEGTAKTEQRAGAARGADRKVRAKVTSPEIIAVRVRHDLCPLCKELDPKFPELVRQANNESVLFVTLDLSSQTTQKQAALLVGALGLQRVWTGDLSKIGSVTFLDGKSKRILSFVQTVDRKEIEAALQKAVDSRRR